MNDTPNAGPHPDRSAPVSTRALFIASRGCIRQASQTYSPRRCRTAAAQERRAFASPPMRRPARRPSPSPTRGRIADPAVLLSFGENGWSKETVRREDAAGMGLLSLARRGCTIASRTRSVAGWRVDLTPAQFLGEAEADVLHDEDAPRPHGTAVRSVRKRIERSSGARSRTRPGTIRSRSRLTARPSRAGISSETPSTPNPGAASPSAS